MFDKHVRQLGILGIGISVIDEEVVAYPLIELLNVSQVIAIVEATLGPNGGRVMKPGGNRLPPSSSHSQVILPSLG